MQVPNLRHAVDAINEDLTGAQASFSSLYRGSFYDPVEEINVVWFIESAFAKLILLAEAIDLPLLRKEVIHMRKEAAAQGFMTAERDPEGDPHLKWPPKLRQLLRAITTTYGLEDTKTVIKDLETVLRACLYSITDKQVFPVPPLNENDVHRRIEAVLRCLFPDLRHKPPLSKPIKNFVPDTGLPSIQTLIEYKFLCSPEQVGPIVDEVLADTRGYTSKEWDKFIYVIYETQRFRPETEWKQQLQESGVSTGTEIIVLSGEEPSPGGRRGRPRRTTEDGASVASQEAPDK